MSGNHDSENIHENSTAVDNVADDDNDVGVNSESTNNQDLSYREANYDSNNSNEDGVMVGTDNNGSGGDSDGVVVSEDAGREDMFMDAPEDLGADGRDSSATFTEPHGSTDDEVDSSKHQTHFRGLDNEMQNDYMVDEMERLRAILDKTINEKESNARRYKEEMETASKGIANLQDQMRDLINKQLLLDQRDSGSIDNVHGNTEQMPLEEMVHECSIFLRNVSEGIQDLNSRSTEASMSHEVVDSYLHSVRNEAAEAQAQKNQYIEGVVDRTLGSLTSLVYVGDLTDNYISGKIAHVEKSVYALIENYNWFLYQSDQLRQCLMEVRPDLAGQNDYGVIFSVANEELLGFKQKEATLGEKLSHFEIENSKLIEQLEKHKAVADSANTELERLKAVLEQEKHRSSSTKEKLSLAVTKGKALVQQRDTLKQAIANKTNELERCLIELKDQSNALEAAEVIKEELLKSQIVGASLQEMLAQKDSIIEKSEDILFQSGVPGELNSKDVTERIKWLVDERNALKDVSLKFHQLADALLSIDLPENFSFSDLQSRLGWLTESFDQAKAEVGTLQNELIRTRESLYQVKAEIGALQEENIRIRETAFTEMDQLTALLSTALVEKCYVEMELEDMSLYFEEIVQKEHLASSEKELVLRLLLEASGVTLVNKESSEIALLVEQCIAAIKEQSHSNLESLEVNDEILQKLQILLYVNNHESTIHENLLEEEMQKNKTEVDKMIINLKGVSEEVTTLRAENESLKKDLERTEDKSALIREKLTMAVKKGKGLVQERDNLKQIIDEKSSNIEKLTHELQTQEGVIIEYKNENSRLSAEVEGIAKLQEDLLCLKDRYDELEINLSESNKLSQDLMDSINSITLPADFSFMEPVEKLTWLSGYMNECQTEKAQAEQQLEKAMLEVETLSNKVSEGHSTIKSLEDALAVAEEKIYQLAEEKRRLENEHMSVQEQLQRAIEEAGLFVAADAAKVSLEKALSLAETKISTLNKEKEEYVSRGAAAEAEVDKARAEIADLTSKLSESTTAITKLEDTVSYLETRISVLNDENSETQTGHANMENELKKLREEADAWDSKLQAACSTVKSLEEELSTANNDIAQLCSDKKAMEQEISTVSSKLNACMEELAVTRSNSESRLPEVFEHLKSLELLGNDETISLALRKCCEMKFESLKEMDSLFRNIRAQCAEVISKDRSVSEEPSCFKDLLATNLENIVGVDSAGSHANAVESDDISLYVQKIVESFNTTKRTSAEKVGDLFSFLNECNASIMQELHSTCNWITPVVEKMNSQNQKMKRMEGDLQVLEDKVTSLEDDISVLLSACTEATEILQFEVDKLMSDSNLTSEDEVAYAKKFNESKHMETVEKLLSTSRKVCSVSEMFEKSSNLLSSKTEELQNNLNEAKSASEKVMEERQLYRNKVHELETDIAALQNLCSEQRFNLENYQDVEVNLMDKEKEISSLQDTLMMRKQETEEALVRASRLENILERVNTIQISSEGSLVGDMVLERDSACLKKLHYVIDSFPELQHQIESVSLEKEEMQTALSVQRHEIEHLREQVQDSINREQELAKAKSKVVDMESEMDRIIQKFSDIDVSGDQKSVSTNDLVGVLENMIMTVVLESKNLKSRVHELETQIKDNISNEQELANLKGQLLDHEASIRRIILNLGGDISENHKSAAMSNLVEVLETLVMTIISELEELKSTAYENEIKAGKNSSNEKELAQVKGQLSHLEADLQKIIQKLRDNITGEQKVVGKCDLVQELENVVTNTIKESESSRSRLDELELELIGSQKTADELLLKVKTLEDSLHSRSVTPEIIQERSIFEAPSQPSVSEISEIEDMGSVSKSTITPVPSSAHARTTWKGSSEHIAVNIESETSRLIDNEEAAEDKGVFFKSLNASGLVPKEGKIVADRIDGIWVSSDRFMRSRPGARLGLVAYWLFLHIWLLGTIL